MADSLKSENTFGLVGLLSVNLAVFYCLLESDTLLIGNWSELIKKIDSVVPAVVSLSLMGILNSQFSPLLKARLVFLRWENPLPGSEAFTRYAKLDSRINVQSLEKSYGPLPSSPAEQNALWYRLYKSVENEQAVSNVHRAYLFSRDYTCLALMMLVILGIIACFQFTRNLIAPYLFFLVIQFYIAGQAARNNGKRFVSTVLAIKSAQD